jgi:hypothetical protein
MLIKLKHGWIFVKPHSWKKTPCIVGGGVQPGFFLPTFSAEQADRDRPLSAERQAANRATI